MTVAIRASGSVTGVTAAVTAVNPSVPAAAAAGDLSVLIVTAKPYDTVITTPSGWTKIGQATNGTDPTTVSDTGSTLVALYVKESATPGAIGNIGQTGANSMAAMIGTFSKDPGLFWDTSMYASGADTTSGTAWSVTGNQVMPMTAGDMFLVATAGVTDSAGFSGSSVTAAGATLSALTSAASAGITTGSDHRFVAVIGTVTAGTATGPPVYTATAQFATTGTSMFFVLHESASATLTAAVDMEGVGGLTVGAVRGQPATVSMAGSGALTVTGGVSVPAATLVDDFSGALGTNWVGNSASIVGGRARITVDTGYNGIYSEAIYTIKDSSVYARVYPPAAGGATTAVVDMKIDANDGTQIQIELDIATGLLWFRNSSGYYDGNAVSISYDPVQHAWWRIREAAGTLYWETSPNSTTWTNRRTTNTASPAWVNNGLNKVVFVTHRDAGTNDYAEIDNVNVVAASVVTEAVSFAGAGVMAVGVSVTGIAAVAMSGAGSLVVTPSVTRVAAVPMAGAGGLTVNPLRSTAATVGMAGAGTLVVSGSKTITVAVSMVAAGVMTVTAVRSQVAAVAMSGAGSLTVVGARTVFATVTMTGVGTLVAGASSATTSAVAMVGTGVLVVAAVVAREGLLVMAGSGSLAVIALVTHPFAVSMAGVGLLAVTPVLDFRVSFTMAGVGVLVIYPGTGPGLIVIGTPRGAVVAVGGPRGTSFTIGAPFVPGPAVGQPRIRSKT